MNLKKGIHFPGQNMIFYLAGLLIILGIKCYYRQADCDSLLWILAPTARWVELLSKIPFTYLSGTGYVNHSLRLVIASSCSGVRFMIIVFATLVFSFVHVISSSRKSAASVSVPLLYRVPVKIDLPDRKALAKGLGWIAVSVLLSWVLTVFVNGLRIITAIYFSMYLEDAGLMGGMLTPDRVHTMTGVVVYFIALLTIHHLAGGLVQRMVGLDVPDGSIGTHSRDLPEPCPGNLEKHSAPAFLRRCMPPVFWYFVLTLGLPYLNRANRSGTAEFTEFAILVTGCCTLILLPYVVISFLRRQK